MECSGLYNKIQTSLHSGAQSCLRRDAAALGVSARAAVEWSRSQVLAVTVGAAEATRALLRALLLCPQEAKQRAVSIIDTLLRDLDDLELKVVPARLCQGGRPGRWWVGQTGLRRWGSPGKQVALTYVYFIFIY